MVSALSILGPDLHEACDSGIEATDVNWRTRLLRAIHFELEGRLPGWGQPRSARLTTHAPDYRANGHEAIDQHLDRLLAAVRQPGAPQIAQVLEGVCDGCAGCPQNLMVCPLRTNGTCTILRDAVTILDAIAQVLRTARDPEYLRNHPEPL